MGDRYRLLVHSARQVVQVVSDGRLVLEGGAMKQLAVLSDASVVVGR